MVSSLSLGQNNEDLMQLSPNKSNLLLLRNVLSISLIALVVQSPD